MDRPPHLDDATQELRRQVHVVYLVSMLDSVGHFWRYGRPAVDDAKAPRTTLQPAHESWVPVITYDGFDHFRFD